MLLFWPDHVLPWNVPASTIVRGVRTSSDKTCSRSILRDVLMHRTLACHSRLLNDECCCLFLLRIIHVSFKRSQMHARDMPPPMRSCYTFAGCCNEPPDADESVSQNVVLGNPKAFGGGVEVDVLIHHEAAA